MIADVLRAGIDAARDAVERLRAPALVAAEFDTAGGDGGDLDGEPLWDGGRYRGAAWSPIHPGRIGGAIKPWAVVVHTTDMHPSTFGALRRAWTAKAGRGAGAHFLLGRTAAEGLHQLADVGRNGNHAGGPEHGWLDVGGRRVHPNGATAGIEVHCAGRVIRHDGRWRTWTREDGRLVPIGAPLPDAEVQPDPAHRDRGWHLPTAYQLAELEQLLRAFESCPVFVPPRPGQWGVTPHGRPPSWAPSVVIGGVPVVGHVTLDPDRKTDPGPVIAAALQRWAA